MLSPWTRNSAATGYKTNIRELKTSYYLNGTGNGEKMFLVIGKMLHQIYVMTSQISRLNRIAWRFPDSKIKFLRPTFRFWIGRMKSKFMVKLTPKVSVRSSTYMEITNFNYSSIICRIAEVSWRRTNISHMQRLGK